MGYPTHGSEYHSDPPGFVPVVMYVELNTSPPTNATGGVQDPVDFDIFYDVDQDDLSLVVPDGLGLSYAAGVFTATEDGVWLIDLAVDIVESPGDNGFLNFAVPSFGYNEQVVLETTGNVSPWRAKRQIIMRTGQSFGLYQSATVSSLTIIDGYAAMEILRIAGSVA